MSLSLPGRMLVGAALLAMAGGCGVIAHPQLDACQSQNRVLQEQNRAQLAEIENLKAHTRQTENQLAATEQKVAVLEDQLGLKQKQLSTYQEERETLHAQVKGLANARGQATPEVSRRLEALSQRYPSLHYDPKTGISKLDFDILFDSGQHELKPAAQQALKELASVLQSAESRDLRVLVVGHTDDQAIAKKPAREQYNSNFDLSTARAQAVADYLRSQGLEEPRLGVAGFAASQPVAPNLTRNDRHRNRRVEIFVLAPEVPVVGWADTMPSIY